MIKIEYKGFKLAMPYEAFESITRCEGLDDWIENCPRSSFIVERPVVDETETFTWLYVNGSFLE
jgi:hypothetical protein